jgi:acetyltransferase
MPVNLDCIFRPRSIAVIGASRRKGSVGRSILHNLIMYEFNGKLFPVNPYVQVIHSIKCYPSVEDIPDEVDLAIIVVPARYVPEIVEQCGRKGVKGLVVITAGFKETGEEGLATEQQLLTIARRYGMRVVGPNCMGVLNTEADVKMDATFAPDMPLPGKMGFMSQSGALGVTILNRAQAMNLGLSMFVSLGNKADISANDLLAYWGDDENTELILMYLESFGNPRKFTALARELAKRKPVLAVKAGRTMAGARAASSHTGALAGMDVAIDALLSQCGVIRASSIKELFDLALALLTQPLPAGRRVGIVTNGGGPGIMAADACVGIGLTVPTLTTGTRTALKQFLPGECSVDNPVDLIASADAERYREAVRLVLNDPNIDSVIVLFTPPLMIDAASVTQGVIYAAKDISKPVLACIMGQDEIYEAKVEGGRPLPVYSFPEAPAMAIKAMDTYRQWKEKPEGRTVRFDVDREGVREVLDRARREKRRTLNPMEVAAIMEAYGLPMTPTRVAGSAEEAVQIAKEIGYPVAMKAAVPDLEHKSDIGGVALNLKNEWEVEGAFHRIGRDVSRATGKEDTPSQMVIQRMVSSGMETILGMIIDPSFGPLLMFGLGGIYVEVIKDVALRVHPITDIDAEEMVRSIKGYPLLAGARGEPAVDLELISECLLRLSQLVGNFHEIAGIDINPLILFPERDRCRIVDAKITLLSPEEQASSLMLGRSGRIRPRP